MILLENYFLLLESTERKAYNIIGVSEQKSAHLGDFADQSEFVAIEESDVPTEVLSTLDTPNYKL